MDAANEKDPTSNSRLTIEPFEGLRYENEMASSRLQGLLLSNGLWLLVYMQRLGLPGVPSDPELELRNRVAAGGTDALVAKDMLHAVLEAESIARIGLAVVGLVTTVLYAAALWYGLRHVNAYWRLLKGTSGTKNRNDGLPSRLLRSLARAHYYVVPVAVSALWAYLLGEVLGITPTWRVVGALVGMPIMLLLFMPDEETLIKHLPFAAQPDGESAAAGAAVSSP